MCLHTCVLAHAGPSACVRTQLSVRVHRKRPFTGSTDKAALHILIFGKIHGFRPHINFALMLRSEETHVCPPKEMENLKFGPDLGHGDRDKRCQALVNQGCFDVSNHNLQTIDL